MKTRKYKTKHRKTRGGNEEEKSQVNPQPVNPPPVNSPKGFLNGWFTSKEDINKLLDKIDVLLKEKGSKISDSMTVGNIKNILK